MSAEILSSYMAVSEKRPSVFTLISPLEYAKFADHKITAAAPKAVMENQGVPDAFQKSIPW